MTNGGDEVIADGLGFTVAGPTFASRSDVTTITRTGDDSSVAIQMESGTPNSDNGNGRLVMNASDGSASNVDSPIVVEAALDESATYAKAGSSSGSAFILKDVTVAAA